MYTSKSRQADFEVSGQLVYAILSNIQSSEVQPMLKKYALDNLDVNQWYSAKTLTELFEEMLHQPNFTTNFVAIGVAASNLLIQLLPAELQSANLEQILMVEEELIHSKYRNGNPGYIHNSKINASTYISETHTPWPDDLIYGFAYGFVRHFCPMGKRFTLRKDPVVPGQDEGGDYLRLLITLT